MVGVRATVTAISSAHGGRTLHRVYRDTWEDGTTKLHERAFCGFKPAGTWLVTRQLLKSLVCRRCVQREALR